MELIQLIQIKMFHQLQETLSLKAPKHSIAGHHACEYSNGMMAHINSDTVTDPTCMLLPPCD